MGKVKSSPVVQKGERAHRTQAARRAETREQIRAAAWELFTTVGFEAATTQAIAKRAGVAAGTVFLHASDKEDLLFLVMHDRLSEIVDERLATVPDAPSSSSSCTCSVGSSGCTASIPTSGARSCVTRPERTDRTRASCGR